MNYNKQIKAIMNEFDFDKVSEVMHALNWTWVDEGIPNKSALRKMARRLLKSVTEKGCKYCSCGGFTATRSQKVLHLSFEVEELSAADILPELG